jgi:hypothetical protein
MAEMIKATDTILEYRMVDQDPLPRWSFDRVTLLGDAARGLLDCRDAQRSAGRGGCPELQIR